MKNLYLTIIIFLFFITSISYAAGKFYKWTDSNGQVHYSQVAPPSKDSSADNIVKIGGKSSSVKMQPYEKGKYLYCGSIELPNAHLTDALIIKNIKLGLKEWIRNHTEAEQEYNKILNSQQKDKSKLRKLKTHFEERACRVTWANKRLKYLTSTAYKNGLELDKLEKKYDQLKKGRKSDCTISESGKETGFLFGDEAQKYHDCTKRYDNEMQSIRKKLKRHRRKLK